MEARGGNANQIIAGKFSHRWTQINTDGKLSSAPSADAFVLSVSIRVICG
jgi:hypothetical protein